MSLASYRKSLYHLLIRRTLWAIFSSGCSFVTRKNGGVGMSHRVEQQIGKYKLGRLLGQGEISQVYLGKHTETGAEVAIKILNIQLSPEKTATFLEEGQKISRLIHPNIRRTLEVGIESQTPYLVLEYLPNGTLRERHPAGARLSPGTILPYVLQIANALHYLHSKRMLHGDIKPENLLVGEQGQILINDCISTSLIARAFHVKVAQLLGTVDYSAPEQLEGKPRPASDQYSLAMAIYEWLCGQLPFQGSLLQIAGGHLLFSVPSLRQKNPAISETIENVILTALSKDWRERYASIQGFAKAFEHACQNGTFVPPTPPAQPEPDEPHSVVAPAVNGKRPTIFISYSHADKPFLDELHPYLKPLERDGNFDYWDDARIVAGANWKEEIQKAIESARIAICLVSADFLASEFITHEELPLLLAARDAGTNILPVIVRHCPFELSPLRQFQAVNEDINRPLSELLPHERERVWTNLVRLINFTIKAHAGA
jgi:serine/threonine protein kinase